MVFSEKTPEFGDTKKERLPGNTPLLEQPEELAKYHKSAEQSKETWLKNVTRNLKKSQQALKMSKGLKQGTVQEKE